MKRKVGDIHIARMKNDANREEIIGIIGRILSYVTDVWIRVVRGCTDTYILVSCFFRAHFSLYKIAAATHS